MGEMRRANAREDEERTRDRFSSTLAICASIIAAARLARDERTWDRVAAGVVSGGG